MGIFIHSKCGMNHGRPMRKGEDCEWPKQPKQPKNPQPKKGGK